MTEFDCTKLLKREILMKKTHSSLGFSPNSIKCFKRVGKPLRHQGCVNSAKWSVDGCRLFTGSDDRTVKIWDSSKDMSNVTLLTTVRTSHRSNIFCAEECPFNHNRLVSSAADGCVISNDLLCPRFGEKTIRTSAGMIHMFAFDIDQPNIIYTAEDSGEISRIDLRMETHNNAQLLFKSYLKRRSGSVPIATKFVGQSMSLGSNQLVIGGETLSLALVDMRTVSSNDPVAVQIPDDGDKTIETTTCVKLWSPRYLTNQSSYSAIAVSEVPNPYSQRVVPEYSLSGMQFSKDGSYVLASYQGDQIYMYNLFGRPEPEFDAGSVPRLGAEYCFGGHINQDTFLKTVSFFGPHDEYVLSGSDSGHIWIWETKSGLLKRDKLDASEMEHIVLHVETNNHGNRAYQGVEGRHNKLAKLLYADNRTCNGAIAHPFLPAFVSYGIESSAKVWADEGCDSNSNSNSNGFSTVRSASHSAGMGRRERTSTWDIDPNDHSMRVVGSDESELDLLNPGKLKNYFTWARFLDHFQTGNRQGFVDSSQFQVSLLGIRCQSGFEELFAHPEVPLPRSPNAEGWTGVLDCHLLPTRSPWNDVPVLPSDLETSLDRFGFDSTPSFAIAIALSQKDEFIGNFYETMPENFKQIDYSNAPKAQGKERQELILAVADCCNHLLKLGINCDCVKSRGSFLGIFRQLSLIEMFRLATDAKQKGTRGLQNKQPLEAVYYYCKTVLISCHLINEGFSAETESLVKDFKKKCFETDCQDPICRSIDSSQFGMICSPTEVILNRHLRSSCFDLLRSAIANIIMVHMQENDFRLAKNACDYMKQQSESFPDGIILDAKYYYRRGVISVSLKDPEEAVSCLNEALKLNPTDPMIAKKLKEAKLLFETERKKEARKYSQFFGTGSA